MDHFWIGLVRLNQFPKDLNVVLVTTLEALRI